MTYCRPGSPVCGGGLTLWPCASALGPNSVMALPRGLSPPCPSGNCAATSNETAAYRDRTRCTWYPPPTARCHPGSVIPLSAEVSLARECPVAGTLLLALRDVPPRLAIRSCRMPPQPLDARDNLSKERPRQVVSPSCKVKCRTESA